MRNISLCFRGWVFLPIWTMCNSASLKGMPDRGHTGPEWTIASTAIETVTGESHTLSGHRSQILDTDSELLRKPQSSHQVLKKHFSVPPFHILIDSETINQMTRTSDL